VNTNETLAVHNGGGDALGLANSVRYSIANWGVPASKAFVTGSSSGAMMTNVMAAAYPDIFNAAAVDSGVPYGCWAGPDTQSACPRGQDVRTPAAWVSSFNLVLLDQERVLSGTWLGCCCAFRLPRLLRASPQDPALPWYGRHTSLSAKLLRGDQGVDKRLWLPADACLQHQHPWLPIDLLERDLWWPAAASDLGARCWPLRARGGKLDPSVLRHCLRI
jgi:pimeloyl-ACP methyl ester carboxylesterase